MCYSCDTFLLPRSAAATCVDFPKTPNQKKNRPTFRRSLSRDRCHATREVTARELPKSWYFYHNNNNKTNQPALVTTTTNLNLTRIRLWWSVAWITMTKARTAGTAGSGVGVPEAAAANSEGNRHTAAAAADEGERAEVPQQKPCTLLLLVWCYRTGADCGMVGERNGF